MELIDRIKSLVNVKKTTITENGNTIEITDTGYEKTMRFNNIVYSRIRKGIYTHQYWDFFVPAVQLYENPMILMIGLGAGTVPYQLSQLVKGDYNIDIVEVSKPIIDAYLASAHDPRVNVIQADGAEYVRQNKQMYDLILLDAFVDANIPNQFFEIKFISDASECLKDNGILAINYLNPASGVTTIEQYSTKLALLFKVYKITVSSIALNIVLLCSKSMDKEQIVAKVSQKFTETRENEYIPRGYRQMEELH